jgi:hypothetical protein
MNNAPLLTQRQVIQMMRRVSPLTHSGAKHVDVALDRLRQARERLKLANASLQAAQASQEETLRTLRNLRKVTR